MKNFILFFSICIFLIPLLGCKGENNQLIEQEDDQPIIQETTADNPLIETIKVPTIYGTWQSIELFAGVGNPSKPTNYSCTYTFKEDGSIIYNRESFSCKGKYYLYKDTNSYYIDNSIDTVVAVKDLECNIKDFNCGSYFFQDPSHNGPRISFINPTTMFLWRLCIEGCREKFKKVRVNH